MKLVNIGFGNVVAAGRIVAIVSPDSSPIKRIIQDAKEKSTLIDATYGRRTRAVIVTDSDHVILSAVQPETVANRLNDRDEEDEEEAADRPRVGVASLGEEGEVLRRGWKCEETVCEGGILGVRRRKRRDLREGEQNGDEKVQLFVFQGGVVI